MAIAYLRQHGPTSAKALAVALGITTNNVNNNLAGAVKRGQIKVQHITPLNGRKYNSYSLGATPDNSAEQAKATTPPLIARTMPVTVTTDAEVQLAIALRSLLDGYDRALATLPRTSIAHGIVEEAFGRTPALAATLLPRRLQAVKQP